MDIVSITNKLTFFFSYILTDINSFYNNDNRLV